jgi:hypothetical protein
LTYGRATVASFALPIEVQQLPPAASDDAKLMARITDLINDVYAVAESGSDRKNKLNNPMSFGGAAGLIL